MRRFRKPVGVKAPREFESPPLRFREKVTGFTTNRRACERRGGFALGKTAMFFNGFPRFLNSTCSVVSSMTQFEPVVFKKSLCSLILPSRIFVKMASLQRVNEFEGRFEPR